MTRLEAMRQAIMTGRTVVPAAAVATAPAARQASSSPAAAVRALRQALAAEKRRADAAEARLRRVLAEVARQRLVRTAPPPPAVETRALPESTEIEVIEPDEVIPAPVDEFKRQLFRMSVMNEDIADEDYGG